MLLILVLNEIKNCVLTMRFLVSLLFVLMVYTGSSIIFSKKYSNQKVNEISRMQDYQSNLEGARSGVEGLYDQWFVLIKKQELTGFFSTGSENRFPQGFMISPDAPQGSSGTGSMLVSSYGTNYKIGNYLDFDLTFIVGILLSFLAIILTFDTICGDRELGVLKQVLSNAVPRSYVVAAKFLGILTTLLCPILLGSILSVIVFQLLIGQNVLFLFPWETAVSVFISLVYLSIFIGLGIAVSGWVTKSSTSLAILLLIWISANVLAPGAGSMLVERFYPVHTQEQHEMQFQSILTAEGWPHGLGDLARGTGTEEQWKVADRWEQHRNAEFENFVVDRFNELTDQAKKAENFGMFSPYVTFRRVMEWLAGTGLGYHTRFFHAVREYRNETLQFITDQDRMDPASRHHIISVNEIRAMSKKPVDPALVPHFQWPPRGIVINKIGEAVPAGIYLVVLNVICLLTALSVFLRMDVR